MSFGKAFALIMLGVVGWGVFHAVGTYFGGQGDQHLRHDVRRSLIVMACVVAFLAFWGAMLLARKRRLGRETHADDV
jgi:membrane protein DedA with SNARE-associated domain